MKFTEQMKEVKLTCAVRCNVRVNKNNYTIQSAEGMDSILKMDCFNRCMNIKLEQGPFIKDLGEIGEDKVPVMFMWPNGMYYTKNGPAKVVDHTFYWYYNQP